MNSVNQMIVSDIPLIWVEPAHTPARRLAIWLPGFSGTKEGVLPQLEELAARGFVAISFDPHQHSERRIGSQEELRSRVAGNIRRYFWPIMTQTTEDIPTVIDWAITKLGVTGGVGIGGISMGGDISVAAAGVDPRIATVAACKATADWLRPGSFEPPGTPDKIAQACYDRCNPLTHLERYAIVRPFPSNVAARITRFHPTEDNASWLPFKPTTIAPKTST